MKREWDALCTSQAQFIEYVDNNLTYCAISNKTFKNL